MYEDLLRSRLAYISDNFVIARITTGTSTRAIYGFEVLLSIGTGSYVQAGYTTIYAYIAPQDGPVAVSFMSLGTPRTFFSRQCVRVGTY